MRCAEPGSHIDDEYARVGLYEPKIVITTSRDPSSRLLQFAKVRSPRSVPDRMLTHGPQELRLVFPNSYRINRGNYVMKELVEACRANEVTDLVMIHEHRGIPGTSSSPISGPATDAPLHRRNDHLPPPARPDTLIHTKQRYPPARYHVPILLHRLRTIPTPDL